MNRTLSVAALLADLTGPTRLEQLADEAGVSADWLRGYLRAQDLGLHAAVFVVALARNGGGASDVLSGDFRRGCAGFGVSVTEMGTEALDSEGVM